MTPESEFADQQTWFIRDMERKQFESKNPALEAARRVSDLCAPAVDPIPAPVVRESNSELVWLMWDAAQEGIAALAQQRQEIA